MTDIKSVALPFFPVEDEVRQGIELLFFAYRDFTAEPDAILAQYGFGRAHHRVIHFVGRHPQMTVGELLDILKITKQSLSRVLGQLVQQGFIIQYPGPRDRRQRLLDLTPRGCELERQLHPLLRTQLRGAGPGRHLWWSRGGLGQTGQAPRRCWSRLGPQSRRVQLGEHRPALGGADAAGEGTH